MQASRQDGGCQRQLANNFVVNHLQAAAGKEIFEGFKNLRKRKTLPSGQTATRQDFLQEAGSRSRTFRTLLHSQCTAVTLTGHCPLAMLIIVKKSQKPRIARAPRIRVPSGERALFTIDDARFVGVLQRLSLSGGSAVLSKGPIPQGTMGGIVINTVFGKVSAQVEFLQTGADGIPLAQAFRFLGMGSTSAKRFADSAKLMEEAGYGDAPAAKASVLSAPASETFDLLLNSVRRLAANLVAGSSSKN